jgi:hypothetical protein
MEGNVTNENRREHPIEGQSHWCDGWTADEELCCQIVSNDSDHCEAGHPNQIRTFSRSLSLDDMPGTYVDAANGLRSLSIEDIPSAQSFADKNEIVPDYDVERAAWEKQWDQAPTPTAEDLVRNRRDRERLEKIGLADFEFAHPRDAVAVRIRGDATMWGETVAAPSVYRDEVGLAVRGTPVSGYEVLVRFAPDEYCVSFFWRELVKVVPVPGESPKYIV